MPTCSSPRQTAVPPTNRRNGKTGNRVKTGFGTVEIDTPRDRQSTFSPQILPKRQTVLGEALDHKVISLYGKGMSYTDICTHLEDLYGLVVSPASLTAITNRVLDDVSLAEPHVGKCVQHLLAGCYSL